MRITELTGYKNDPLYNIIQNSASAGDLDENLEANGFKKYVVGTGLYSSVLSRPDLNYVVKIFDRDPGYEKYLNYVVKYQKNPHVPKMRGKVISLGPRFKVVRLEKLEPYDYSNVQQRNDFDAIDEYVYGAKTNREYLKGELPEILPVLDEIMSHSGLDLHSGNLMFRGSVPVITDPLSSFGS